MPTDISLIDTHAHPHMEDFDMDESEFLARTAESNVKQVIVVGTSAADSKRAIEFASKYPNCFASVGLHPHEASSLAQERDQLANLAAQEEVIAIGECGLDYYYLNSNQEDQVEAFKYQIELAQEHSLPMIFHVRNPKDSTQAFDDFFAIIDQYRGISGVVHSFTANKATMEECIKRGLYIGLNGIITFSKDTSQLEAAKSIPLDSLVLETDSPFLTPEPFRGMVNHSGNTKVVAEFLANLRGERLIDLASATSTNAKEVFKI